jgi:hypothetical protein
MPSSKVTRWYLMAFEHAQRPRSSALTLHTRIGNDMSMLQPDHDDDDHIPHLVPADPLVKITRLDIAFAIGIVVLTVLWLALA